MARAIPGPVISSIAGSIGGVSFRNDRSGLVISNKQQPTRKFSAGQLEHRGILSASARGWAALDDDIKRAWTSLAATEQIPTAYSRGRRWTGRQLYTCFFIQAEHQYTPLPARWLPTPPLFWPDIYCRLWYFACYLVGDDYTSTIQLTAYTPINLEPDPDDAYISGGCATFWAGFLPLGSQRLPRIWVKVAPMAKSFSVANDNYGAATPDPCPHYWSGSSYNTWAGAFVETLGYPAGYVFAVNSEGPVSLAVRSLAMRCSCVTDDRIYYSGPWYGDTYAYSRSNQPGYENSTHFTPANLYTPTVFRNWDELSIPVSEY